MVNSIRLSPSNQIHFFRVQHLTAEIVHYSKVAPTPTPPSREPVEKNHSGDAPQPK